MQTQQLKSTSPRWRTPMWALWRRSEGHGRSCGSMTQQVWMPSTATCRSTTTPWLMATCWCSVTDSLSFQLLTDMKKDIDRHKEKKDVPIIILGNKSDLAGSSGGVDEATAERWAAGERLRVWQVNTVDRNLLLEPFMNLASRLNPQPNKTSFPQLHMGRKNKD
ncbi:NF-kappa-B inhibitor-interacting Ras-like protein 1 isoform X2 [Scylla paramamosain]|uniref:NF-kappa-B inhibitor-interacting Ras-like protein 1 isoform X2 n=1 Tax=Scylla paramamosain TaxID=85552 RepID=UPI00308379C7